MDIGLTEEDIMRLLHIIDPYNNQQITFSECVTLFSTEVLSEKEPIGILQKLASLQLDNF